MHDFTKRTGLALIAYALTTAGSMLFPVSVDAAPGPQQIYNRAWQLVKENYYDTSFGAQDWQSWQHKFDGHLTTNDEAFKAIELMVSSLHDPYTRLLEPKAFGEENDAINSVVVGIGIGLRPYDEAQALVVNDVIEDSPAFRAGLECGDTIVAIDGKSAAGVTNEKAAEKIRGQAGTQVLLSIKRGDRTFDTTIVRAQVTVPAVTAKILKGNVGYIRLSTFMPDEASIEFRSALHKLAETNGLIIDLRANPGGLLANAVEIADMLMEHGKIVTTVSRSRRLTDACQGDSVTDQPLVLLVDRDSASASEILAGALKDNGRAMLVGTRTYGKGLVQEINRLPGGAGLHITVARYLTPQGTDINKVGIKPDIEVSDHDKQLEMALNVLQNKVVAAPKQSSPQEIPDSDASPPSLARLVSPRS
jgi:carboxyl-terminal processing protease